MERLGGECRQDVQPVGRFLVNGLEVSMNIITVLDSGQHTLMIKVLTSPRVYTVYIFIQLYIWMTFSVDILLMHNL